jgi:hypothetical protein
MVPAFIIITFTVTGNGMIIRKPPKGIVLKAAYTALASVLAQARNNLIDLMAVWGELTTPRKERKSFIITDSGLAGSGANRGNRSGSRHIVDGEEDGEECARRRREIRVMR